MDRDRDIQRTVLLLAAHPHDEFALAATLVRHLQRGDDVWCAWFAHDDREKVERLRREEATQAMERMGVPLGHLIFAELPALGLTSQLRPLVEAVRDAVERVEPDLVYCPAYEGGHPDHDALNFAAWEGAALAGVECREYPMYRRAEERRVLRKLPRFARMLPGLTEPDLLWLHPKEVAFKRELWRVYRSQRQLDVLVRFSGDEVRFFSTEQTRILPLRDYTKPPHDRPLLYEEQAGELYLFDEFAKAVRNYLWTGGLEDEAI